MAQPATSFSSPLLAQQTPAAHSSPLPFPQPSTLFPVAAQASREAQRAPLPTWPSEPLSPPLQPARASPALADRLGPHSPASPPLPPLTSRVRSPVSSPPQSNHHARQAEIPGGPSIRGTPPQDHLSCSINGAPHPVTLASIRSHPQTPDSPPRSQSRNRRTALARSGSPPHFHRHKSRRLLASDPGATPATSSALAPRHLPDFRLRPIASE